MVETPIKLRLQDVIENYAIPLTGSSYDYAPLLDMVGDATVVLIGEATHGTHEFYHQRAEITKRLITEKGFTAVTAEADWPDAYNINQFVRSMQGVDTIEQALSGFKRFPTWMWRNKVVADFARWLRDYNQGQKDALTQAGFYGLDLYSLNSSMDKVIDILERIQPEAAQMARKRYGCFDNFRDNLNEYGFSSEFGLTKSCEDKIVHELIDVQEIAFQSMQHAEDEVAEELFNLVQNARLVKNAEHYYRAIFSSRADSWNVRDSHMLEMLEVIEKHLSLKQGKQAKLVVWAHNSHIGDARATEQSDRKQHNIGQLTRETYGDKAVLIGFSTHSGTVRAAANWDGMGEVKAVRPALPGSYEELFHHVAPKNFYLPMRGNKTLCHYFDINLLQRAIGVVYVPETERISHYYYTRLASQFDAMIHIDHTTAIESI